MFGSPEAVPGGKALPFYASYRIALRKSTRLTRPVKVWDGYKSITVKETYGQKIRATVEKSKLSRPFRDVYFVYDLGRGEVDEVGFMIAHGLEIGAVIREGNTWWIKGSKKKVIGASNFQEMVEGTPRAKVRLRKMILDFLGKSKLHNNEDETKKEKS